MTAAAHDLSALTALLNTLLPGDGADWPAAGDLGLAPSMAELAALAPGGPEALAWALSEVPPDFPQREQDAREDILLGIEGANPDRFGLVVTAAYNAYYTHSGIRDLIERLTGYPNRPPQPEGYPLEPFDEGLLADVRARGPIWRQVG